MTLIEFLHARVNEDERYVTTLLAAVEAHPMPTEVAVSAVAGAEDLLTSPEVAHLLLAWADSRVALPNTLLRVLAECTAKRLIIDHHTHALAPERCVTLELLALPYHAHPDYESWTS